MDKNNDYNLRQLKLMNENLILYEKKRIDLGTLVGNLEGLLNAIEAVELAWEEKFLKEWSTLEIVYAINIINETEENFTPSINPVEDKKLIHNAVINLKKLIHDKID